MRKLQRLATDDRAIEGLPIRLVIALVVGVASLSVMMGMISGLDDVGASEVDARPAPEVIQVGDSTEVTITVVEKETGKPVENARVLLKEGTARYDADDVRIMTDTTDENGNVTFSLTSEMSANLDQGEMVIDVEPPSGYKDDRQNAALIVIH